jgi:L-amino acid N-acyltransferase
VSAEWGGECSEGLELRDAQPGDVAEIRAIYNEVIANSTAVFSDRAVTLAERERWLEERRSQGFPVIVATRAGAVVGFGSFGPFRTWPGYRHTVEHSVHVRADCRGRGVGSAILGALIERASALGMHAMIAGVDAGNAASIALHERFGFTTVATLPEVARKFERWLDLVLLELLLP